MYSPFIHPDKVIARGSAILTTLLVATIISSFATVDAAVRSGEVSEYVIAPSIKAYQSFISAIEQQAAEDAAEKARNREMNRILYEARNKQATSSSNVKTEINITNGDDTSPQQTQPQVNVRYETTYPANNPTNSSGQSYEEWSKEVDKRAAESQAEYDAAVKKMNEDYNSSVQQMNNDYDSNVNQMNKDYEESVKKNQAEFDAFKAENGM